MQVKSTCSVKLLPEVSSGLSLAVMFLSSVLAKVKVSLRSGYLFCAGKVSVSKRSMCLDIIKFQRLQFQLTGTNISLLLSL